MNSTKEYTIDEIAQITRLANEKYQAGWLEAVGNLDNVQGIYVGMVTAVIVALGEWEKGQKDVSEARKDG